MHIEARLESYDDEENISRFAYDVRVVSIELKDNDLDDHDDWTEY